MSVQVHTEGVLRRPQTGAEVANEQGHLSEPVSLRKEADTNSKREKEPKRLAQPRAGKSSGVTHRSKGAGATLKCGGRGLRGELSTHQIMPGVLPRTNL